MSDPVFTSANADPGSESAPSSSPRPSWFRTLEGRRYGIEIALIIVVKLVLLVALWLVVIHPWPRPSTAPATAVQQFYSPAPAARHD